MAFLGKINDVKVLLSIFFLSLQFSLLNAELRLSEIMPESIGQGKYDDLQLRYNVGNKLVLLANSPWCMIQGKPMKLSKIPKPMGLDWLVPEELVKKLGLTQQYRETTASIAEHRPRPVVVIDPGHGGKDPGAIGLSGVMEKDVVLDISKRVAARLSRENIVVEMTRDQDEFVDLHYRGEKSNRWRATIFVSIHCNSNPSREMEGYQLYRQNGDASVSSRANFVRSRFPLPQFQPIMAGNQKAPFSNHEKLFIWKDKESEVLSEDLHAQLEYRKSQVNTQPEKNLCVLRETMAPSVLVELDFVSNPVIEYKMTDSTWREKMAEDIVKGILSYLGMGPKS